MSKWMHINLRVKDYDRVKEIHENATPFKKPTGIYKELISYVKEVVDSLSPERFFYFFEPDPFLFLALEVKDLKAIDSIKDRVNKIKKPDFIDSLDYDLDSHDEGNGEAAIDFFHAGAKFAFFRIGRDYKPNYHVNDETKLVHCLCNQLFATIENEKKFYAARLGIDPDTGVSVEKIK